MSGAVVQPLFSRLPVETLVKEGFVKVGLV